MKLKNESHIALVNGNYDVTFPHGKTFESRKQFDAFVRRECRLLNDEDEAKVRKRYEAHLENEAR